MSEHSKTVAEVKGQLSKFSGIISKGFRRPKQKLIKEMRYGIQAAKDVKLSNIARTLKEEQALIKTEDRLSRNLDDEDFTEELNEESCRLGASKVTDDMVIAIDPGDIRKKYARWKCDESYRYIKQCYNLEDIRVRSYTSIRNIVVLVLAVSYFAAVYLGHNIKLRLLVERVFLVSKRFFGVPSFFNYAIADGSYNLLFPDKTALRGLSPAGIDDFQLRFEFD